MRFAIKPPDVRLSNNCVFRNYQTTTISTFCINSICLSRLVLQDYNSKTLRANIKFFSFDLISFLFIFTLLPFVDNDLIANARIHVLCVRTAQFRCVITISQSQNNVRWFLSFSFFYLPSPWIQNKKEDWFLCRGFNFVILYNLLLTLNGYFVVVVVVFLLTELAAHSKSDVCAK